MMMIAALNRHARARQEAALVVVAIALFHGTNNNWKHGRQRRKPRQTETETRLFICVGGLLLF
jgi:hypothetical protein